MYKCNVCCKKFRYTSEFKRHKNRKNPCKKSSFSQNNGTDAFECIRCHKSYSNKSNLKRHMKICKAQKQHTQNNGGVVFECPKCYRIYKAKSSLVRHINIYCTTKPDSCKTSSLDHDGLCLPKHKNTVQCYNDSSIHYTSFQGSKTIPLTNEEGFRKNDRSLQDVVLKCGYCFKIFSRRDNLARHQNTSCQLRKEREEIYQSLLKKMENMENEIKELRSENNRLVNITNSNDNITTNTNSHNTNNMINSNNQTFNIQLVAFGKEDKQSMNNKEIFNILRRGFGSVPELVKAVHFNEEHPENHNIYISNMRDNYVMVYDGEKWALRDRTETIKNLFDDGRDFLVLRNDQMKEKYNDAHKKYIRKFERFDYDIDNYPEKRDEILNDIKLILYNKKDLPLKVRKVNEFDLDFNK